MGYIKPTENSGREFYLRFNGKGKFSMLNLLKYKEVADYATCPNLAPSTSISGKEAYTRYMKEAQPLIQRSGGRVIYFGVCGDFVIGPESEKWDAVLIVEHLSAEAFIGFANDEEYLKIAGHRTAALDDSRLLPMFKKG